MHIIVEGTDGAGKSTLVQHLVRVYRLPTQHSEGPPHYPGEMDDRVERYFSYKEPHIFDRHPCISQPIYGTLRETHQDDIHPDLLAKFYSQPNIFIYCEPIKPFHETHVAKPYEDFRHVAAVAMNYDKLLVLYQQWALTHAHYIHRMGESPAFITRGLDEHFESPHTHPFDDIADFHAKFGLAYYGEPRQLPTELHDFRFKFLDEELDEYLTGVHAQSLSHQLDALVDLAYVTLGTAYLHGFDFKEAWRRVHLANMKKIKAQKPGDSLRGNHQYDVVKPPGWQPPDLTDLCGEKHDNTQAS